MGEFIIGCLDGYGYLRLSIAEIADQLRQSRAKVLRIVKTIQQLEPKGVGARSLEECLLIQAESLGCLTPEIRQVILYYLPDLAGGQIGTHSPGAEFVAAAGAGHPRFYPNLRS